MAYIGRAPTDTGEFRLIDEISSSFDGSTQSFDLKVGTLAITPTKENIIIALDGVLQDPSSAYTVSGSTIKFSEGPVSDTTFYGVLTGQVGASIANSTITNDHVSGTAAIDQSKLNLSVGIVSASAQLATDISGSLGTNAALIRSLTGAAISGSIVGGVSGSAVSTGSFGSTHVMGNLNIGTVTASPSASVTLGTSTSALTISGSIFPEGDNNHDLGSLNYRWAGIYTTDLELSNKGVKGNDIDGTSGHWTIQEGKENLYLINNETNKKFKFKLEEIE